MLCIVGADGFFGTYLQKHILSLPSHEHILAFNHTTSVFPEADNKTDTQLELWDNDSIKRAADVLSRYEDIKILFLASRHNPDAVKKNPEGAKYINTVCYERFLEAIKDLDVKKLIYSSSDTVYGESKNGYVFTENDTPSPINIYGEQKLAAENITRKYGFSVARYSYMTSPSLTGRKKHFFDEIASTLSRGEQVFMLTDWVRSALSYKTAAEITYNFLLQDNTEEILNICSDTPTSKYDIGLKIAEFVGADKALVIPCKKEELGIFTEKRADDIILSNAKMKALCNTGNIELCF